MSRWALLALVVLLAGCATTARTPVADPDARWAVRRAELTRLDTWSVTGRLGVRTSDEGGSATLVWDRDRNVHRLELYGPFGGGRVRITQDASGASLIDSKKRQQTAATAEELLFRQAGWHVPFDAVQYWVAGLPAPGAVAAQTLDEHGRLETLRQFGWEVRFLDYRRDGGYDLPKKIFARALPGTAHLAADDGRDLGDRLEVRLVIKRWDVDG